MNAAHILKQINETYSPLSESRQQELLKFITIRELERNTTRVREGQFSDKTFYIVQGCAQAYYLRDGKDITD